MPLQNWICLQYGYVCNTELNAEREIKCDLCKKYIHTTCSSLTRAEIQCLKANNRNVSYFCDNCKFNGNIINELKQLVMCLQEQIKALREEITPIDTKSNQISAEHIISEINERRKRAKNIIILNVKEPNNKDVQNRIQSDIDETKKILNDTDLDVNNFKYIRLGKFSREKVRPIKVIFNNEHSALHVIKNKRNINNENLRVFADQTKLQREYFFKVKQELHNFIAAGDNNKTIKYINNIPTIVDKSKN